MGIQLLFCVETDQQCNSDWIYIKSIIDTFYDYNHARIRLEKAYMGGKGNYNTAKFKRCVDKKVSDYKKKAKGETVVIYCFDCDEYDRDSRDAERLKQEEQYCIDNNYKFIWFCKDIERVFIGEKVPDDEKKSTAEKYLRKGLVSNVDITKIEATKYKNGTSNLAVLLDEYMERKAII